MTVLSENITGDFFDKKGNYNYYTAELYGNLFLQKGPFVPMLPEKNLKAPKSSMARHKAQLKKLIFNPWQTCGEAFPIVGGKVAIFDPEVMRLYNFGISSQEYLGVSWPAVFSAKAKARSE